MMMFETTLAMFETVMSMIYPEIEELKSSNRQLQEVCDQQRNELEHMKREIEELKTGNQLLQPLIQQLREEEERKREEEEKRKSRIVVGRSREESAKSKYFLVELNGNEYYAGLKEHVKMNGTFELHRVFGYIPSSKIPYEIEVRPHGKYYSETGELCVY